MTPFAEKKYMEAVSKGDEHAFEVLFLFYFPRVKGFISGILQNLNEAEDISQDVFISMWQNREKLPEIENLNAYLFRIAKNAVIRRIERFLLFQDYQQQQTDLTQEENDSLEEEIYAKELEYLIATVVEKMPPQRQTIYKMSRMEGLSNQEISERLSISKRTVENHLTQALADIRKVIGFFICTFFEKIIF